MSAKADFLPHASSNRRHLGQSGRWPVQTKMAA